MPLEETRRFVGKQAQHRMRMAANDRHWFQTSADKILFHTIMAGADLPVPVLLAATQPSGSLAGVPVLCDHTPVG